MKISHQQIEQIQRIYGAQQRRQPSEATDAAAQRMDKVELSAESRVFEAARKKVDETPDVRHDLVERIKAQRAAGEYNVESREVARKMLARLIADSVE